MNRTIPAGLLVTGFQRIVTNSTATAFNTTVAASSAFLLSVETHNLRARFDGTSPTVNTGVLYLSTWSPYYVEGVYGKNVKILGSATGTIVNVTGFKRPGEVIA